VSINEVIRQALSLMNEQLRLRQIEVHLALCDAEPVVIGNPIQLEQVFINLLTNARDAVADSPSKVIQITCTTEADAVNLAFRDSGPGIPAGLEQRIFDPFFTTKDVGMGTGLGLSITYGIINEHQGTITVASQPGTGATFLVQLPLAHAAMPPKAGP
jgi:C4-dicarboxylate-specific signal transduction histidine kinase